MSESSNPSMKKNYLLSCAIAVASAAAGIVFTESNGELGSFDLRLVGLIVLALVFVSWMIVRAGRVGAEESAEGAPQRRMWKMSLLWLALAAVMGLTLLRLPVMAAVADGPGAVPVGRWVAGAAGVAVLVLVVARWIPTWKERPDGE